MSGWWGVFRLSPAVSLSHSVFQTSLRKQYNLQYKTILYMALYTAWGLLKNEDGLIPPTDQLAVTADSGKFGVRQTV